MDVALYSRDLRQLTTRMLILIMILDVKSLAYFTRFEVCSNNLNDFNEVWYRL